MWTDGKNGSPVCIIVDDYGDKVLADVETEHITENQFRRFIEANFPRVKFRVWIEHGYWFATGKREVA